MTADDIAALKQMLARIEGKLDQVLDLGLMDAEPAEPEQEADDDDDDDFPAHDLLDTSAAAERFGIPRDRLTRWARETDGHPDAIGKKVGGRWMISVTRIRALKL